MALSPTGYAVAGAGVTAANGNFVAVTGANATLNGATQYTNGTDFLAFITTPGAPYWGISALVNQVYTGTILYANNTGASTTNVPLTGWTLGSGTAPVPTLTVISGGGGGATTAPTTAPVITATSGPGSNTIGFTASTGTGVIISRGTVTGGPYTVLPAGTVNQTTAGSFIDSTATVGTAYYYTAVFYNGAGNGPASNEAAATATQTSPSSVSGSGSNIAAATPNAAIAQVTNLVCTAGDKRVLSQWTNPAQLSSVTLFRRIRVTAGTAPNILLPVTTLSATTAGSPATVPNFYLDQDAALVNGTTYEYEVFPNA